MEEEIKQHKTNSLTIHLNNMGKKDFVWSCSGKNLEFDNPLFLSINKELLLFLDKIENIKE